MSYQPPAQAQEFYAPARGKSIASMVIGFVSIVFGFTFILPVIGVVLGCIGLAKEPFGRGMAITGLIVNLLCIGFWIILVIFFGIAFIAIFGASGALDGLTLLP